MDGRKKRETHSVKKLGFSVNLQVIFKGTLGNPSVMKLTSLRLEVQIWLVMGSKPNANANANESLC